MVAENQNFHCSLDRFVYKMPMDSRYQFIKITFHIYTITGYDPHFDSTEIFSKFLCRSDELK